MSTLVKRYAFEPLSLWNDLDNWNKVFKSYDSTKNTPIDIIENDKSYIVKVDVPGFEKEEISISVDDNILTIQGEKKQENDDSKENYIRKERYYSSFSKSISLYDNIDTNKINAELKNGILDLTLPKKTTQEKTLKKIEIK